MYKLYTWTLLNRPNTSKVLESMCFGHFPQINVNEWCCCHALILLPSIAKHSSLAWRPPSPQTYTSNKMPKFPPEQAMAVCLVAAQSNLHT